MKRILTLFHVALMATFLLSSCNNQKSEQSAGADVTPPEDNNNKLTEEEKTAGWELLFDGKSLDGWKRYGSDTIGPLWSVKEGMIVCDGTGLGEGSGKNGGSLMTKKDFGNFELSVEWKITPGGNSGILYHVVEKPEYKHDFETGPEMQVMDDAGWKGDKLKPAQLAGSNYDMFAAPETKTVMPVGEWNAARIVYNNGHVEHWLNNVKLVEFEEGSDAYNESYKKSKWVDYPAWNKSKTGAISLQDHGAPVYYRNVKIKQL